MADSYTVEVLNLGKRPVPGVSSGTTTFDDPELAWSAAHRAVGELVLTPGLVLLGAERRDPVGGDGILAAARLTAEVTGGRVEVLLRRRPGTDGGPATSSEDAHDDT